MNVEQPSHVGGGPLPRPATTLLAMSTAAAVALPRRKLPIGLQARSEGRGEGSCCVGKFGLAVALTESGARAQ